MGCEPRTVTEGSQQVRRMVCDDSTPCQPQIENGQLYTCPAPSATPPPNPTPPADPTVGTGTTPPATGCEPRRVDEGGQQARRMICAPEATCAPSIVGGDLYTCPAPSATPPPNPTPTRTRDSLRFGSVTAEGDFALFSPVRQMGLGQPTYGGSLWFTLNTASGDRITSGFSIDHTNQDRFPPDETWRYGLRLGLSDTSRIFRFGSSDMGADMDVGSHLYVDYVDNRDAQDGVAVGTETRLGLGIPLWRFRLGLGAFYRADIGSSGDNPMPLNVGLYANLGFNFDDIPTSEEMTPGARLRLRGWRIATNIPQIFRIADMSGNVTHIDGLQQQNMDLIMSALAAPQYGLVSYDLAQIGINADSRTATGLISGFSLAGGLAMELAGILANEPGVAGMGASLFCGGAGSFPTAVGSTEIWANRGTMIGCGLLQAGVGLAIFFTAPDLSSGSDNPIQHVTPGSTPDDNPHLDTGPEGRRAAGAQIFSAGLGSFGGGFFLIRDPNSQAPAGAGVTVSGQF